jgi:hypothetical protein
MPLKLITPPALEPVTVAELKTFLRLDTGNAEPAPGAVTAALKSPAAAGNVDNGAHRYRATFVTADGETDGGTISGAVTVADKTVNGQISLSGIPLGGAAVTARKLYRTVAGGSTYLFLATIANNTATTYTDNIADASLGAGCPSINTTSDPLLNIFVAAARAEAEARISRQLLTATWELYLDSFSREQLQAAAQDLERVLINQLMGVDGTIQMPLPPLQSITSIKYLDTAGVEQTLAAAAYRVDTVSAPGRVTPAYGYSWPSTYPVTNAVVIRFVAGYGDAAAAVPLKIRQWIMAAVGAMYENREIFLISPTSMNLVNLGFIDGLLDDFRWSL